MSKWILLKENLSRLRFPHRMLICFPQKEKSSQPSSRRGPGQQLLQTPQPSRAGVPLGSRGTVSLAPRSALGEPASSPILEEQGLCLNLELERIHGLELNVFVRFVFSYSIWTEGSNQHHPQMPK